MNVLKPHLRITIAMLLATGTPQREIARRTGVDRKTIRRLAAANSPGVATGSDDDPDQMTPSRPPAPAVARSESACEAHRPWIETQGGLGRNAVSIYQDLVEAHGCWRRPNIDHPRLPGNSAGAVTLRADVGRPGEVACRRSLSNPTFDRGQ